jgi:hypothetical protein
MHLDNLCNENQFDPLLILNCRFQWLRGLRRRSTAARLLRSWVRMCVVCCQVEVSATSWSLVQRSPTDCGASLCVIKKPRGTRRPLPELGWRSRETNNLSLIYFVKQSLHVWGAFIAHHQEVFTGYEQQLVRVICCGAWQLPFTQMYNTYQLLYIPSEYLLMMGNKYAPNM